MKSLVVIGRRWFDSVNGDTYHTAEIIIDGRSRHRTPMEYGYGEHYMQTAAAWLEAEGYIKLERYANGSREPLFRYLTDRGIGYTFTAFDVKKREL